MTQNADMELRLVSLVVIPTFIGHHCVVHETSMHLSHAPYTKSINVWFTENEAETYFPALDFSLRLTVTSLSFIFSS